MADRQEQKAPAGRIALLAALLAMDVSAAAAFGRVLVGRAPSLRLALAAGIAVLLAGAMERRHILLAAVVSAAAFVVFAALMVFPDTTRIGFPTAGTFRAMGAAFGAVGRTANVQAAPALPLTPLMLAALTAAWAAAFSSHALAIRARSPFLAVVPPAALIAFTNLVMKDGVRPAYVIPFLASVIALLFADGLWRLGQWGPITMWHGRRSARLPATTTRGARRVAVACLGIALIAPGLLPGFRSPGLVDVQGKQQTARVSINPIVDIRAQLLSNPNANMFTVRTDPPQQAAYWRIAVDDVFNGRQWSPSDPGVSRGTVIPASLQPLPGTLPPGAIMRQHFVFQQYGQPHLPAAYQPIAVDVPGEQVRYDPTGGVLFDANGTNSKFSYDVTSVELNPNPDALDAVTSFDALGPTTLAHFTKLPSDTPSEIAAIGHRVSDSAPTLYRKILAIQDYLKLTGGFRYSVKVPPGHSTNDILRFLTTTKAGFCEQFAGSMAVLLRSLGVPTRVAVGFTSGAYDPNADLWRVTSQDAHAWVEVLFPGFGWLAFEPTPGRSNPVAGYTNFPPSGSPSPQAGSTPAQICRAILFGGRINGQECVNAPASKKNASVNASANPDVLAQRRAGGRGATGHGAAQSMRGHRLILYGLALLLILAVAAIPGVKLVRRRLALTRSADARARILAAYVVLSQRAGDLGWGRRPAETLMEYRTRLKKGLSLDGDLDNLTDLAGRAAYADATLSTDAADQARTSARRVAQQIRRSAGFGKSVAGWFRVDLRR